MMSIDSVEDLVSCRLAPRLKEAGFKKRQMTWNRRINGVVHVVDLQTSHDSFTLNFGVFIEEVWKTCWGKPAPQFVREHECFPRFRVGKLLSGFEEKAHDKWWRFRDEENVVKEVEEAVFDKGLPVLDGLRIDRDALDFARRKLQVRLPLDRLSLGVLEHLCGEESSGLARLQTLFPDEHWGQRAQAALNRLVSTGCGA